MPGVDEEKTSFAPSRELLATDGVTNTFLKITAQINPVARAFIAAFGVS
ncbi:hypothetical protein [Tateyamaria pelophila]|nr:hypothetical protein [Tateyamaria pelophila]